VKSLRWWILGAALGTFAAGVSVGMAIPRVEVALRAEVAGQDADAIYVEMLTEKFGLTARQRRSLAIVLANSRREELAVLEEAAAAQLPPAIQNRLLAVRSHTGSRIRAVLDDAQLARYDRDVALTPGVSQR
jgi:hypothetical protein